MSLTGLRLLSGLILPFICILYIYNQEIIYGILIGIFVLIRACEWVAQTSPERDDTILIKDPFKD